MGFRRREMQGPGCCTGKIVAVTLLLITCVALPARSKVVFPSLRTIRESPNDSYVLGQFTLDLGWPYSYTTYSAREEAAVITALERGKAIEITVDLRLWKMPSDKVVGVMCYPLRPGRYTLREYRFMHARRSSPSTYLEKSAEVFLGEPFEVRAGQCVYIGSYQFREKPDERDAFMRQMTRSDPEKAGSVIVMERTDDPAGVLSVLDLTETGLGKALEPRVKRADFIVRELSPALHDAVMRGDVAQVTRLLSEGSDVNVRDRYTGSTPLHRAGLTARKDIMELLLAKGADVNAKNDDGRTPLHVVVLTAQKDLVELLLAKGADVNARDRDGLTPLALVQGGQYWEIAQLLRAHGGKK